MLAAFLIYYLNLPCDLHQVTIFFARRICIYDSTHWPRLHKLIFVQIVSDTRVDEVQLLSLIALLFDESLGEEDLHQLPLEINFLTHESILLLLNLILS